MGWRDILHGVGDFFSTTAKVATDAGRNIIEKTEDKLQNFAKGEVEKFKESPGEYIVRAPQRVSQAKQDVEMKAAQTLLKVPGFAAKAVIGAPARVVTSAFLTGAQAAENDMGGKRQLSFTPKGAIPEFLMGSEPIKPFQTQFKEATDTAQKIGYEPGTSKVLGPGIIALGSALDVIPGGGKAGKTAFEEIAERGIREVGEEAIEATAKEGVEQGVESVVRNTADDVAETVAKNTADEAGDAASRSVDDVLNNPTATGGAVPPVKPPSKPPAAPAGGAEPPKLPGEEKPRGFTETLRESEATAEPLKQRLDSTYTPITNKETVERAQRLLDEDREGTIARIYDDAAEITADDNAAAQILISEKQAAARAAEEAGDLARANQLYDEANSLATKASERGTKLGQATQIYSLWNRQTPGGALRFANKLVQDANRELGTKLRVTPKQASGITQAADELQGVNDLADGIRKALDEGDVPGASKLIDELSRKSSAKITARELRNAMKKGTASTDEIIEAVERMRNIETGKLLNKTREVIPSSMWKKVSSLQTFAQLLNPKTIIRNVLGNFGMALTETASDMVGAAIDKGIVGASRLANKAGLTSEVAQRVKGAPALREGYRGFKQGFMRGTEDVLTGVDTAGIKTMADLETRRVFQGGAGKGLETLTGLALRAPDRAFYQAAYDSTMAELMKLRGVAKPEEWMQEVAHFQGLYRTFQDDTVISSMLQKLKSTLNYVSPGTHFVKGKPIAGEFGLGDMILKYPKTPGNLLSRGLDYSPVGFLKAVGELARPLIGGPLTNKTFNRRAFIEATSRAFVGSGVIATGAVLAGLGIISGRKEKDKDIASLRTEAGIGGYRINLSALKRYVMSGFDPEKAKGQNGDVTTNYDWFQPGAIAVAIGANINDNQGDGKGPVGSLLNIFTDKKLSQKLVESIFEATDTVEEQPILAGLKYYRRTESLGDAVIEALESMPSSFVPTFINQIRDLADSQMRETKGATSLEEAWNKVLNRVPIASSTLPTSYSTFGDPREKYPDNTNLPKSIFNTFFNPGFTDKIDLSPEAAMVLKIYQNTGETAQAPRIVDDNQSAYNIKFELTGDQLSTMQKDVGQATRAAFSALANDPEFYAKTDTDKAKELQNILTDIYTTVKVKPFLQYAGVTVPQGMTLEQAKDLLDTLNKDKTFKALSEDQRLQAIRNAFQGVGATAQ